jgi:AcrR family transcriptional regulator
MSEALSNKSPKSDSKPPTTREALLEAAIAELSLHPEGDFRIEAILAATGASFSSLYHHFGNREGLIIEAQIAIFKSPISKDLDPFAAAALSVTSAAELKAVLAAAVAAASSTENAKDRAAQIAILAAANSRPVLAEAIAKEQEAVTMKIAAAFDIFKNRGIIEPEVSTTLIGQFIQVTILGQSVLDAGAGPVELAAWQDLVLKALLAVVNPVTDN